MWDIPMDNNRGEIWLPHIVVISFSTFGKGLLDFQSSPLKTKDFKVDLAVHLTKIMFMRHVCAFTYCGLDTASQNFQRIFFFQSLYFEHCLNLSISLCWNQHRVRANFKFNNVEINMFSNSYSQLSHFFAWWTHLMVSTVSRRHLLLFRQFLFPKDALWSSDMTW